MNLTSRISAFLVYLLPVIGWIYVYLFQRKNALAVYHLKQAIGLFLFLFITFLVWAVSGYLIALIPYAAVISVALFAIVLSAYVYGAVLWIIGMVNALRNRMSPLPAVGKRAEGLPIN